MTDVLNNLMKLFVWPGTSLKPETGVEFLAQYLPCAEIAHWPGNAGLDKRTKDVIGFVPVTF